jgi:uncharacterized protein (DUF362 family)
MNSSSITRREFLRRSLIGAAGVATAWQAASLGGTARADAYTARVGITKGGDRADNAFRAMQMFKQQIAAAVINKRIIIKPNVVNDTVALADTHVDWLEGILEFLKSIGRTDVTIAESNPRSTFAAFEMMGYFRLLNNYPVKLVELNQEGADVAQVWKDATTLWPIRVSRLLRNPNNFIISCPRIKTHNNGVATVSLKNVVMGSPMVDPGYYFGQAGATKFNKTPGMHGQDTANCQFLNDNLYRMAKINGIHPHLSVIDGYQGMQGNGPSGGDAAAVQKLGIASLDWVAADRVALKLVGGDAWYDSYYTKWSSTPGTLDRPTFPAYLNYCNQAGLGEWDLSKIEVLGEPIAGNIVNFTAAPGVIDGTQLSNIRANPKE